MSIDPSSIVYFEWHFIRITATLVFTWITMAILISVAFFLTRSFKNKRSISKGQYFLEALVVTIDNQIKGILKEDSRRLIAFVGTLFIFILLSNILSIVPGFIPPTGSLNTTIALSLCVFLAVPAYGISSNGIKDYLKAYTSPSVIMLPFNIIGEFSRTISMAIRLYGNVMSLSIIVGILLGVIPLLFPVVIQLFGLLTGAIQAYIFAVLATVYISSAIKGE